LQQGPSLTFVRKFGKFSGTGEIEAVLADDALGYVYYSDEQAGIRKYHADPDASDASSEIAFFAQSGYKGDREGLALYATDERSGYIVSTDQISGASRYLLYRREGSAGNPHDHTSVVAILQGTADSTDGIEVVSRPLSREFSRGLLVAMNSGPKNFLFFNWPDWSVEVHGSR
jgi:3-phytase